jgi:tetratricopeptide (TPR) repeat protein
MEGRHDDALASADRMLAWFSELGIPALLAPPLTARVGFLRDQGRLHESAEVAREVNALLEGSGHTSFLSTGLVELGLTLYLLGELEEAERLAVAGEELGAAEDVINFSRGRHVRAMVAADQGRHDEALALAESASDYAFRTDFPEEHAGAHHALGHALQAAGRTDEARAAYGRELEVWERYGWVARAQRVRELLVEL